MGAYIIDSILQIIYKYRRYQFWCISLFTRTSYCENNDEITNKLIITFIYVCFIFLNWIWAINFQIYACFRGLKGGPFKRVGVYWKGRLFDSPISRVGAYLIISFTPILELFIFLWAQQWFPYSISISLDFIFDRWTYHIVNWVFFYSFSLKKPW